MRKTGAVVDRAAAMARTHALVKAWRAEFKVQAMYSFAFGLYSRVGAVALAQEACRRMSFFYDLWVSSEDEEFRYSDADLASCPDDYDSITLLCDADQESELYRKGMELRTLLSKRP